MRRSPTFLASWETPHFRDHRLLKEDLMTIPEADLRSPTRRTRDEQIAAEPPLAPPQLPPDAASSPVDAHLLRSAVTRWP